MNCAQRWMSRIVSPQELSHSDAAFELNGAALTAERSGSGHTVLRFAAAGQRRNADGSYVVERVALVLLRQDGSLVRLLRWHESNKPFVLGSRMTWSHELNDAELAESAAVLYLIETRVWVMRTLLRGELGAMDPVAEAATWPILAKDVDRGELLTADVGLSTRRGERVDISLLGECTTPQRNLSFAAEVYFLDGAGAPRASAMLSGSLTNGFAFERTEAGIDRATAAEIRSLEVRARIETTVLSELGAIALPEACRIVR